MSKFKEGPLVLMLRDGRVEEFNALTKGAETADLSYANLRGVDLRDANLRNADLRGSCCHSADLRGVDLYQAQLEGATLHRARVSGAYFPPSIEPVELKMALDLGTRIRGRYHD